MRMSLIVAPACGSDSSQAPVQRNLILTPNKYRKSGVRPSGKGELQGANTKSSKNRNNKTEIAHATLNHSQVSSVAISVHCCLHWRSHRHLASVFAPYIYPAILHRCSHLAFFLCAFPMVVQARFSSLCVPFELL